MKNKIALMLTVLGVAATLTPVADAKFSGSGGGGSGVCICMPPVSVK